MNDNYNIISKILNEGVLGAAVWGGGPLMRAKFYQQKASEENDPIMKKRYIMLANRWKATATSGAVGGAVPLVGSATGAISAGAGYIASSMTKKESVSLLEERRKPRKKPAFYYNRLKNQERELVKRYKEAIQTEREEKDSKKKYQKHVNNQRLKTRIDQIRLQMTVKKKFKHLQSF